MLANALQSPPRADTTDDDEPAASPAPKAPRKRAEPPDSSPRSPVEVVVRRGESMGLFARWAKLPMKALYARTDLEWGETLDVGRRLSLQLTENEKARLQAGRATLPTPVDPEPAPVAARTVVKAAPAEPEVPRATTTLRVRRGDSGWRIARRRGTSVRVLELLNPGRDLSRLQIGDEVRVPAAGGES